MKKEVIMAGVFSAFMGLFGNVDAGQKLYKTESIYNNLRQQALSVTAQQCGIKSNDPQTILGVLMETGYDDAVATLISMADGTVSLYFSNGGGIIGVGQHDTPRKACESFLKFTPPFLKNAKLVTIFPLPSFGLVNFYILTVGGVYNLQAAESALRDKSSPISSLYFKAQEVITQARIADEKVHEKTAIPNSEGAKQALEYMLYAATNDKCDDLQKLFDAGISPNISDSTGLTPLMAAAYRGNVKALNKLISAGSSIDIKDGSGYSAFVFACNAGKLECAKILAEHGADINIRDKENSTPIIFAAQHGFNDVIKFLLSKGADPKFKGNHGLNAIGIATQNGLKETVRILENK